MKIGIDISQTVFEGTGVATYSKNLVENLLALDKSNKYVFFGSSLRRRQKGFWPFPPTFLDILWNQYHVFPIEKLIGKIDVFHSSDWTQPPTMAKKVTTIHDLVVFKYPESSHPKIIATQKRRLEWVKKECDLIIADSKSTKNDIVETLKIPEEKIRVVYLAAGEEFKPQSKEEIERVRNKYHLISDYVLTVGTQEPRKNLNRVIAACQMTKENLVIAGKAGWGEQPKAHSLGYVSQEDLPGLYAGAKCFVYPSLYEGFGVPVLEALGCNCPVLTSNVSSLPEVGGDAVTYIDPLNVEEMGSAITNIKRTGKELAQAKKFSWVKTAKETLKVYEEVA